MGAYLEVDAASGQDKFGQFYLNFNNTVTALKGGSSNQLLVGAGVGSNPVFTSVWDTFVVVGSGGGAPSFAANFGQSATSTDRIRYRKSVVLDLITVCGRFLRTTMTLPDGGSATVFTLPSGYRPARAITGSVGSTFAVSIAPDGTVTLFNQSGSTLAINGLLDVNMTFPIS